MERGISVLIHIYKKSRNKLQQCILFQGEDKLELWKSLRVRAGDEILSGLRKGDIKAIDALKAFTLAAIEVDRELNCVTGL